jgi:hypothetical protein
MPAQNLPFPGPRERNCQEEQQSGEGGPNFASGRSGGDSSTRTAIKVKHNYLRQSKRFFDAGPIGRSLSSDGPEYQQNSRAIMEIKSSPPRLANPFRETVFLSSPS